MPGAVTGPRSHSFFVFQIWVKIVAHAPMAAVIKPPIMAAMTEGFSSGPPDEVVAGCTVTSGSVVVTMTGVVRTVSGRVYDDPPRGGSVPNSFVTWPGTT